MSSTDLNIRVKDLARQQAIRGVTGTLFSNPYTVTEYRPEASTFESILYYAGKPEEWTAKLIGNLVSDDPKYDWGTASDYQNQVMFATLFRDMGVDSIFESENSTLPIASVTLGLAAAIANPLDPLNKLKILQLAKSGTLSKAVRDTRAFRGVARAGEKGYKSLAAFKRLKDYSETQQLFDVAKLEQTAKRIRTRVLDNPNVPDITKNRAEGHVLSLEGLAKRRADINTVLEDLYKKNPNLTLDDIAATGDRAEQAMKGQVRVLGLSSPFTLDQIPFLRQKRLLGKAGLLGEESRDILTLGLTSARPQIFNQIDAAIIKAGSGIKQGVKGFFRTIANTANEHLKYGKINSAYKELSQAVQDVIADSKLQSDISLQLKYIRAAFYDVSKKYNLSKDDYFNLGRMMEDGENFDSTAKGLIREAVLKPAEGKALHQIVVPDAEDVKVQDLSVEGRRKLLDPDPPLSDEIADTVVGRTENVPYRVAGHHSLLLTQDNIVLKLGHEADIANIPISATSDVLGIPRWRYIQRGDDSYLVAGRGTGKDVITRDDQLTQNHIWNLQLTAAQLAKKKIGIRELVPSDVIVSSNGLIDIINPGVLVKTKTTQDALDISYGGITGFRRHAIGDASEDLDILLSPAKARDYADKALDYMRIRSETVARNKNLRVANAKDLLFNAENTALHEAIVTGKFAFNEEPVQQALRNRSLSDLQRANGIDRIRAKIREAVVAGRSPQLSPIEIASTPEGAYQIISGKDELTAAVLENLEYVNIKRKNRFEELVSDDVIYVGPSNTVLEEFYDRNAASIAANPVKDKPLGQVISRDYKLTREGRPVYVREKDVKMPEMDSIRKQVGDMLGVRYTTRARIHPKQTELQTYLRGTFGDLDPGTIWLAEAAERFDDPRDFMDEVFKTLNISYSQSPNWRARDLLVRRFNELKITASKLLDTLADRGVLTPAMLNSDRIKRVDGILESVFNGAYHAQDISKGVADVQEFVRGNFDHVNMSPFDTVRLTGGDGSVTIRVGDLVQGPHPHTVKVAGRKSNTRFSKEFRAELKNEERILTDPSPREFFNAGLDETTGHALMKKVDRAGKYERVQFSFVHTGDMVMIGTKPEHTPEVLLQKGWKDGQTPRAETGLITRSRIIINGPIMLPGVDTLDRHAKRAISGRLRLIAKNLQKTGLADDYKVEVRLPYLHDREAEIIGDVTLGQMAHPKYRINIPKGMLGEKLTILADQPHFVVRYMPPKLQNEKLRGVYDYLQGISDDLIREEVAKLIPVNYNAEYFPRVMTESGARAMRALTKSMGDLQSKHPKFKHIAGFMRDRSIHELKTHEVNDVIKILRKNGMKEPERLHQMILDQVHKSVKDDELAVLSDLASAMNDAGVPLNDDFWHVDPLIAMTYRTVASFAERQAMTVVEHLRQSKSAAILSRANLSAFREMRSAKTELRQTVDRLQGRRTALESTIAKLDAMGDPVSAEAAAGHREALAAIVDEHGRAQQAAWAAEKEFAEKFQTVADDIDLRSDIAYISNEKYNEFVARGIFDGTETMGMENGIVPVPVSKVINHLGDKDELIFFSPEVMPVVEKYFGIHKERNQLLTLFDKLQNLWKSYTLFPVPAYHGRNFLSNMFLAWMGRVNDLESYTTTWKALRVISGTMREEIFQAGKFVSTEGLDDAIKQLRSTFVKNDGGESISLLDLYSEWLNRGGSSGGLVFNEFKAGALGSEEAAGVVRQSVRAGYTSSGSWLGAFGPNSALVRTGRRASGAIEDRFRFASFYHYWKRTNSFDDAALEMKKIFYDYRDLTTLERRVLRRVFPFYSWMRHNTPRMLELLYLNPVGYARFERAMHSWELNANDGVPIDPNDIPRYMKEKYGMVTSRVGDHYRVRIGEYLIPSYDAFRWFKGGTQGPFTGALSILRDGITPLFKVPVETLLTRTSFFMRTPTGEAAPIEKVPGEPARGYIESRLGMTRAPSTQGPLGFLNTIWSEYWLKNTLRPVNEASRLFNKLLSDRDTERSSFMNAMIDMFIGHSYEVDPEEARAFNLYEFGSRVKAFENRIRWLRKEGRDRDADFLSQKLAELYFTAPPGNGVK